MDANEEIQAVSPRAAMQAVGGVMIAAAATAALASSAKAQAGTPTDADVLNFALNLEYLEAEYYLNAVNGSGLSGGDSGGTTSPTGAGKVNFTTPAIQQYAQEIAADELAHVKFLRSALGGAAVARPTVDLSPAVWTAAAKAAGLIPAADTTTVFNPYANELFFLIGAFVFEDVGVTAYSGAANLITNRSLLAYAASVLAVEAYHAGAVRTLLANIGAGEATNKIAGLRARLSGADDERLLTTPTNQYNFAPTDQQAQTYRRTPRQVLNIVYGAPNAASGLFCPAGMNGTIRS